MEILLGLWLSFVVELYKNVVKRFGAEVTKAGIYMVLFICSIGWTLANKHGYITQDNIQYAVTILSTSVATYELVIKRIQNALNKETVV